MTHSTAAARYLQHLDAIFPQEPQIFREESLDDLPGVMAIVYNDVPSKGFITGFTYGLSLVNHPKWINGRPELCISVASANIGWARVAAFLANHLRGDCPFRYQDTINFRERIGEDSEMDAFFVYAPSVLQKSEYMNIDIGEDYKISIAGLFPMYASELDVFEALGVEQFRSQPGFDLYDVKRPRIVKP